MKDTITINGEKYRKIKKEEEPLTYETFNQKETEQLTKAISKIFEWSNKQRTLTKELLRKGFGVLDPASICMITAKTPQAMAILIGFHDADNEIQRPITLKKYDTKKNEKSKFSTEYLLLGMKIFDLFEEQSVWIKTGTDYPITIENKHFQFILAPRIDQEDEE